VLPGVLDGLQIFEVLLQKKCYEYRDTTESIAQLSRHRTYLHSDGKDRKEAEPKHRSAS
jgi:hypothetical protein